MILTTLSRVKFRYSAPIVIIGTAVALLAAISALAQVLTSRMVSAAHDGDYDLMQRALSNTLHAMEDEAASDAEIVASIPSVRAAFVKRDRAALEAQTVPMFRTVEPKYSVDQAQFHLPPGVSFLRLHEPAKFGDDQTSYRPMLSEVHQEKSLRKGTAITRGGPAIFGIVPVLDEAGQFAGSFEFGLEFGPVLDELKKAYGIEAAVFFEEKQLREVATNIENDIITPANRVGKYIRYHATHPGLMSALVSDKDIEIREKKHFERTVAGVPWGLQLVPLYNYANHQIGVVALATSFEEDKKLARRAVIWQFLAAFFSVILIAGVVLVVLRGFLLGPLASISERMRALAEGDATKPAPPLEDYCEELHETATAYEKLREERARRA